MTGAEFIVLQSEILKTKEQMRMFQKRGNGFGYKQAKAHLEKLYRKERSVRWN